jgi:hypothetical protein
VIPIRRSALRCLTVLLTTLAGSACTDKAPDDRLLVVDGIEITLAEVEPYVAFLDSVLPEGGRKAKVLRVLDEHLLPMRMAQRAFPEQRRQMLERAQGLADVATNAPELDEQSRLVTDRHRIKASRVQPLLPVAMFLFEPLTVGAVSPPIEVPAGFVVTAAFDLTESQLMLDDYVDALVVGFPTHELEPWMAWLNAEKARIGPLVTYVHPDYREAMPEWLQLPKLP